MEPHFSFTLPSVCDDTPLSCRIYHPKHLARARESGKHGAWDKRGIVVAHPYAPMGGSYDDRIVGIVVSEFLKTGWIVGTFNFRGAHNSKGSTSWTGRPELDDYTSFAAFFLHYMSFLQHSESEDMPATIIFAGYSYGSLILKHLPPVPSILQPFAQPVLGSSADEILHRARKLADEDNATWYAQRQLGAQQVKPTHKPRVSLTIGGEETKPEQRRTSKDISTHKHETGFVSHLRSFSRHGTGNERPPLATKRPTWVLTLPRIRYLLISPLTTPTSTLIAPALVHRFWNRATHEDQDSIGKHPALVVYGDHDMFSSVKKIRDWTAQYTAKSESVFCNVEIAGAGHFWIKEGVEEQLRLALRNWEAEVRF